MFIIQLLLLTIIFDKNKRKTYGKENEEQVTIINHESNDSNSIITYACFKKSEIIREFEILDEPEWEEPDSICRIELWNYDPKQLSDKDRVDKLSLFSSLKDTKNPRVQGEIETVLEEIEWQ